MQKFVFENYSLSEYLHFQMLFVQKLRTSSVSTLGSICSDIDYNKKKNTTYHPRYLQYMC